MTRAHHPNGYTDGHYFRPPRCANCIPKYRSMEAAPAMIKTDDPDGYICEKCGKILLWREVNGQMLLDVPQ